MRQEYKEKAINYAVFKGQRAPSGEQLVRTGEAVFDYLEREGYSIEKKPTRPMPFNPAHYRQDDRVPNNDGMLFFRGLMFAALLSVPLWAIIIGFLYGVYTLIERVI